MILALQSTYFWHVITKSQYSINKIMQTISTFLLGIFTLFVFSAVAQQPVGKIRGQVNDIAGKPSIAATVNLLRARDTFLVKITVADKTGHYEFDKIGAGKYLVSASSAGFSNVYSSPVELSPSSSDAEVKALILAPDSKSLGTVTVTAKRPLVEQKIDRMVVNVEASITNVGASALEVLEKSPGITVDKDGNISLKGKDGVIVLVDGRQTYLSGSDLANYLRSLNASQLDQLEIMTNPPARYDAAGNSGIINIRTKKTKLVGYNGSANLGYGQGFYPKINEGLNLNYRKDKVNLFTNLGHNYNQNRNVLSIQRNFRNSNTDEVMSRFTQEAIGVGESNGYNAKLGMDYFQSKNTTFGVVLNGFISDRTFLNDNLTYIADASAKPSSQTRALQSTTQHFKNFGTNLNFRRVLDTLNSELTADVDYSQYVSKNNPDMFNSYFDASGNSNAISDTLLGKLPQDILILGERVDYLKNLKKGARFEAGLKSSYVETDNDASYDSLLNGKIVRDVNRSNHFLYRENINAAYVNLNKTINKKWGGQLGLRLENTNARGIQMTTGESFNRHYTQLFPTAYLQYTQDKSNSFVMNYGRRIRRPDYQNLNPFINFVDRYTYSRGNPNLRPQFSHNVELSHNFKSFVTTTLNYTLTTDIIQNVLEQNEAKNELFIRKANIARQRQLGIAVNTNIPITKWWKSNIYVNAFNNKFDGLVSDTFISIQATSFQLNGSQQFTITKTLSAELSGWYQSNNLSGVIASRPMGSVSLGFSKQIMKNNGTIKLNIRDIFYSQEFRAISRYGNVDAAFQERNDSRVVQIGFSWRFAKGKTDGGPRRRAGGASDEQNRVGN